MHNPVDTRRSGASSPVLPPARPWLSVLVPVHNAAPFLREMLESVISQADATIELIAADDRSSDGSAELLRQLSLEHPRLRAIFLPRNQGPSATRNALLEVSQGRYLWFMDADDRMRPGAINALRRIVDRHAPDAVLCDFAQVRARPRRGRHGRRDAHVASFGGPSRQLLTHTSTLMEGLFRARHMHIWSKITRREVWGEDLRFPLGRYFEDTTLSPRLILRCRTLWHEPEVWVDYRLWNGSITSNMDARKVEHLAHALDGLAAEVEACGVRLSPQAQLAWAHMAAYNFIDAARTARRLSRSDCGADIERFRQALDAASPLDSRALLRRYLRIGWWWRALRLCRWLRRARPDGPSQPPAPLKD